MSTRKPKRTYNLANAIHNRTAHPDREKKRIHARMLYLRGVERDQTLGPDPMFLNGKSRDEREVLSAAWRKKAKAWDAAQNWKDAA